MDYIPKYFKPYELVPKATYELLKNRPWVIWQLFDPRVLHVADAIRRRYGKMTANTWYWKGRHQYRGWRPARCKVGATYSQHRFGRALDLVPGEATAEEIRQDIMDGDNFQYITCIEAVVHWLHFDVRNYKGLLIVTP
jgi:hypothetical protein